MSEERVLRLSASERGKVTGGLRNSGKEDFCNFYSSPDTQVMKSRSIR
jgi:hypothetical protein